MNEITVGTTKVLPRIVDVLNEVFGYGYEAWMQGEKLPENDDYVIWFPKLSDNQNGRSDVEWLDLLDPTGTELTVCWIGDPAQQEDEERGACAHVDRLQIIFANRPGTVGYEFLGVFECQKGPDGTWRQADGKRHYKRVAVSVDVDDVRRPR